MNLKERGITVGDLVIITILITSAILIINKFKESDKQSYFYMTPNEISNIKKIY